MPIDYLPSREGELLTWATTFGGHITATPTDFGLDAAQATAFDTLLNAYRTAYDTANDNATRTPSSIIAKNDAKDALVANARLLAAIVQATPGVTNIQKSDLGLTVRDTEPTPVPPPGQPPALEIVSAVARTVRIKLHDVKSGTSRGKPAGVTGAAVFSFVGDTPPTSLDDWKFETNTTKTIIDIEFSDTLPNGSQVWLTAFWFNTKTQSGPACQPVPALIPGGMSQAA